MKTGARNDVLGTITSIKRGTVMSQVGVNVPSPVDLSSVMTLESLDSMNLKEGDQVRVVVKAISVLLIKE